MDLDLRDAAVIVVPMVVLVLAVYGLILTMGLGFEGVWRWVTFGTQVFVAVMVLKARQTWSGAFRRPLSIIFVGVFIMMLEWIPHIGGHVAGQAQGVPFPSWFGIDPLILLGFFHATIFWGLGIMVYGLYVFWKTGESA